MSSVTNRALSRTDNSRDIRAPRGSKLTCKSWFTEAPMRMLMNNLDAEVAEKPHELVVYGGIGRAARNWDCYDRIIRALKVLESDESLLIQSGKPVGVFKTHADAPRVLIANSNIVPHWASIETFNVSLLTSWLISGVCHAILQTRASRERREQALRLEAQLSGARLQLLRAQLQPHFLFNTLNSIATLMHRDLDAAERLLVRLGDLLRMALDLGDSTEIPLERELAFTRLYLQIQGVRFGDRLAVEYRVEPEALDALVPSMLLQPLAENAIQHGIGDHAGGGRVEIAARRDGDSLKLVVRDDGPGFTRRPGSRGNGIGLSNLRSRLDALYGARQRVELQEPPEGGLEVRLELPFRPSGAEAGQP